MSAIRDDEDLRWDTPHVYVWLDWRDLPRHQYEASHSECIDDLSDYILALVQND